MTLPDHEHAKAVLDYYRSFGSRAGYALILGGTRHFGFYRPGQSRWAFRTALRQMEDQLAAELDLPAGSYVLDAGCGVGDVARRLARQGGLRVAGIDLDERSVAQAKRRSERRGVTGVTFSQGDYTDLSRFDDGVFDGAYTMETFVHAKDPATVLAELYRVLRRGGRLVMHEYSHAPYDGSWAEGERRLRQVNSLAAMPTWDLLEHGALVSLVHSAGFVDVFERDVSENMVPMMSAFSTLAALPYRMGKLAGVSEEHMVNVMAAAEGWDYRDFGRYNILSATKPLKA